jgi:glycogen phosphorylase
MKTMPDHRPVVAYFSMEVALDPAMPTYAGGLGVLSGDSVRAAADMGIPMVGITLLHRKGYFRQHLDTQGNQTESPINWHPEEFLEIMTPKTFVMIEGRQVWIQPWCYKVHGLSEIEVPVYLIDTAIPENSLWDQSITDYLYGGDDHYRLCQEVVLGLGGVAMLRALGYNEVEAYHMNEGHSALLTLALLLEESERSGLPVAAAENISYVRDQCVFTTHTPVPAGIDRFPASLVRQVVGEQMMAHLISVDHLNSKTLNMIYLGLFFSRYINGVSMRHEEISHGMFPNFPINSVSNGVHALTWTAEPFFQLFNRHFPEWHRDNLYLRYAMSLPLGEVHQAHLQAKQELLNKVEELTTVKMDPSVMTLGFARRMTPYKRANLLFSDLERLKEIAHKVGPLQVIYGGKAHPRDEGGKALIRDVFHSAQALKGTINVVFLEDYDFAMAKYLCSGVDLWLNTPQKPFEASGTSGMKAALNGVPSLSVLDGWWVEGHLEGVTGWSIGEQSLESNPQKEIASLYDKLESVIVPMFYRQPAEYDAVMRSTIAINGSYYNAQRMILQYLEQGYMRSH